jgi:hypothetical protein
VAVGSAPGFRGQGVADEIDAAATVPAWVFYPAAELRGSEVCMADPAIGERTGGQSCVERPDVEVFDAVCMVHVVPCCALAQGSTD